MQLVTEPNRFEIVKLLFDCEDDGKEMCVNEIAERIGATPSSVSHHFAKLEKAGLVKSFKSGRRVCYCLQQSEFKLKLAQIYKILS